ncbi:MAG: ATP-binding protein [bacterium]
MLFDKLEAIGNTEISIEIYDSNYTLIAWKNIVDTTINSVKALSNINPGFIKHKSNIYLFELDSVFVNNKKLSLLFYKNFDLNYVNEYDNISANKLREKYNINFEVHFSDDIFYKKDNNKISFSIINQFSKPILSISFPKIVIQNKIDQFNGYLVQFRLILLLIIYLNFAWIVYKKIKLIQNNKIRFAAILVSLIITRYFFIFIKFPGIVLKIELLNPAYFSSPFLWGIVKSPLDLFITVLFALIIFYPLFNNLLLNGINNQTKKIWSKNIIILSSVFSILFVYRSFGAIVNSLFFDSSIKYFRETSIFPNYPTVFMLAVILMLGFLTILILVSLIILINKYVELSKNKLKNLLYIFVIVEIFCVLFDLIQKTPQSSFFVQIFLIFLSFTLVYLLIFKNYKKILFLLLCAFAGSVIMIFQMGYVNSKLEKENLKIASLEYTRIDDNWIEFLIKTNLTNAIQNIPAISESENIDYKNYAYELWNKSIIKTENLVSEFYFLDSLKSYIDGVNFSFPYGYSKNWMMNDSIIDYQIVHDPIPNSNDVIISGLVKLKSRSQIYFGISIKYNPFGYNTAQIPNFSKKNISDNQNFINFEEYEVLTLINGNIVEKLGCINPTKNEIYNLISSEPNVNNYWRDVRMNNESYVFYVTKNKRNGNDKDLLIGRKTSNISWGLYDFVKIFLMHVIFVFVTIFIYYTILYFKKGRLKFNYQAELLSTFLLITIIPLIILAIYFRETYEEKNQKMYEFYLNSDASKVSNYLEEYSYYAWGSLRDIVIKANSDLGLNFTLYKNNRVQYSTYYDYYYFEDISKILNPKIYQRLVLEKSSEQYLNYSIKGNTIKSYFKRIKLFGDEYILEVNDIFNVSYIVMNNVDIDLFLFGTYSFVIILIIILSIIITNKLSSPIIRLTEMTQKVSNGDLNVQLKVEQKGEIAELITGFNKMVTEIKRMQNELSIKERENAWKEMAKQVAHEIKNPLTPMKLSVQLLEQAYRDKSPKFDQIFEKVMTTIINQIEILKNIASEFSVVAKLPPVKISIVNLIDVINEVLQLYSAEKIQFEFDIKNQIPLISSDSEQLKRVLINLIKNSIEADSDKIKIELISHSNLIELLIHDNGSGIPEANREKIFDDKFTTKPNGMGIGLFLVKNILKSINATIELPISKSGTTIFKITLPVE